MFLDSASHEHAPGWQGAATAGAAAAPSSSGSSSGLMQGTIAIDLEPCLLEESGEDGGTNSAEAGEAPQQQPTLPNSGSSTYLGWLWRAQPASSSVSVGDGGQPRVGAGDHAFGGDGGDGGDGGCAAASGVSAAGYAPLRLSKEQAQHLGQWMQSAGVLAAESTAGADVLQSAPTEFSLELDMAAVRVRLITEDTAAAPAIAASSMAASASNASIASAASASTAAATAVSDISTAAATAATAAAAAAAQAFQLKRHLAVTG